MEDILTRRLLILTLQALLIFVTIVGVTAESNPPCNPKFVILDASGKYTILYEVCVPESTDPASNCTPTNDDCDLMDYECDDTWPPGIGNITSAQFIGDTCKGKIEMQSQDPDKFSVSLLREDFSEKGVHNCIIMYQYASRCYGGFSPPHTCLCYGKVNLNLVAIVLDLELSVDTGDGTLIGPKEENQEILVDLDKTTSNMSLKCTTSVTGSQDFTMKFELATSNETIILLCPEDSGPAVVDGNFIITRQDDDCILTIVNASQEDSGNYSCNIFLPHSNSHYNSDSSNIVSLVSNIKLEKSSVVDNQTLGPIFTALFAIVIVFIAGAIISVIVLNAGVAIYKRRRLPESPQISRHGSADSVRVGLLDGENSGRHYGALSNSDLSARSRPETPNSIDALLTNGEVAIDIEERENAEVESSLDESCAQHSQQQPTVPTEPQNGTKPRTGSKSGDSVDTLSDETIMSCDDLTEVAIKRTTPPSSKPHKYQCKLCGKRYAKDRKAFYKIHVRERKCQQDTKNDKLSSSESEKETGSRNGSPSHT